MHTILLFTAMAVLFVVAVVYPPTAYFIIWLVIAILVAWLAFRQRTGARTASESPPSSNSSAPAQIIVTDSVPNDGHSAAASHAGEGVDRVAGRDGGESGCNR
jgi:energy-coupling factor transporter transmembrane protein EcfT